MSDVNSRLLDRQIRHSTYIERVKAGTTNKLIALLSRTEDDLIEQIRRRGERLAERGFDTGPATTARLNALLDQVRAINANAYQGFTEALDAELRDIAKSEATFQAGLLRETLPAVVVAEVGVSRPDLRTLYKYVNARPMQGRLLKDWAQSLERDARQRIADQIRIGLVEGESIDSIVRRIRGTRALRYKDGIIEINRRNAQAIVRTAVGHTVSVAREETFRDNRDIIKGIQWVSAIDSRVCMECMGLDGTVFDFDKGRRPLAHVGCRCTTTSVTKSWRELGIDLDEIDPGTRRAMDGSVPEGMRYGDWLRTQPSSIVEDALGTTRAKLFREGNLKIDKFTDIRGRELTLAELEARESEAFKAAGL